MSSEDNVAASDSIKSKEEMEAERLHDCPICFEEYDTSDRIPCIGSCGHTICSLCRSSMITSKCPLCNRAESFVQMTVNQQLIDLLGFLNQILKRTGFEKKKPSLHGNCPKCKQSFSKLRICLDCLKISGILNTKLMTNTQLDYEELFDKMKQQAMCGDCVLDNGHFSHKTRVFPRGINGFKSFLETNFKVAEEVEE